MLILSDLGFLRLSHDDCTKISLKPMAFPRPAMAATSSGRWCRTSRFCWPGSNSRTVLWMSTRPVLKRIGARDLQRLKVQGLGWRGFEGESGLAEECVDEVGLALDRPEPAADDGFQLVEGGGGVVAQAAFHG